MCRHVAYIGPAQPLRTILWDTPHSLRQQARVPRELLLGTTCADGFGVAWYQPDVALDAARYASAMPLWADSNIPGFAGHVASEIQIAAVRDATVEGTNAAANSHPFVQGRYSFSHNGYLGSFDENWKPLLLERISKKRATQIVGRTDSEHVFAWLLSKLDAAGESTQAVLLAVQDIIGEILAIAEELGTRVQLNFLLSNGDWVIATRAGNQPKSNSLYVAKDFDLLPHGTVIASEPLGDGEWKQVAEGSILLLQQGAPTITTRLNLERA